MTAAFRGQRFFLSNFYPCTVDYEGIVYPSSEHAYQAAKTLDQSQRLEMAKVIYPAAAKKIGKKLKQRDGWDDIKVAVMTDIVRAKFTQNEDCEIRLLATGDEHLEEANTWRDIFWWTCGGKGKNWLGRILMQIRSELQGSKQTGD